MIAPAITTYSGTNPAFRLFEYDSLTGDILDYTQFYFDLNSANENGTPEIYLEYSAAEAYNLTSFTPESFNNLVQNFIQNQTLFQEWYLRYAASAPSGESSCVAGCKQYHICDLSTALSTQYNLCMQ